MSSAIFSDSHFDLLKQVLAKVPTGDNLKDFDFRWSEDRSCLYVKYNVQNAVHSFNQRHTASLLSLGCLIRALELMSQSLCCRLEYEQSFDLKSLLGVEFPIHFVLDTTIQRQDANISAIAKRIITRSTFRLPFNQKLEESLKVSCLDSATKVYVSSPNSPNRDDFCKYVCDATMLLWDNPLATQDFLSSVRFFSKAPLAQRRKLPSKLLGIPFMDEVLLFLFRTKAYLLNFFVKLPPIRSVFYGKTKPILKNAEFFVVTTKSFNPSDIVSVGRTTFDVWLQAEAQGYKVQPLSTVSFGILYQRMGCLPEGTPSKYQDLFGQKGPQIFSDFFKLPGDEVPAWLFRFGKSNKTMSL